MSNTPQKQEKQDRPAQTSTSSQPNTGKVDNNTRKGESVDQKRTGGMKGDACSTSGNKASDYNTKSSKA